MLPPRLSTGLATSEQRFRLDRLGAAGLVRGLSVASVVLPVLRIDFLADVPPLAALDRLVDAATPVLATFGYKVEARGSDWAHWVIEPFGENVIRAYAFETPQDRGVSLTGQGDVPDELPDVLGETITDVTGWEARPGPR